MATTTITELREPLAGEIAAFARSLGFGAPTRMCSWCGQTMEAGGRMITHGICSTCEPGVDEEHGGARGRGSSEVDMPNDTARAVNGSTNSAGNSWEDSR